MLVSLFIFTQFAQAANLTALVNFGGTDGDNPVADLIQATDGNLYGTTESGGINANSTCENGCGTVFRITPSGTLTTLYSFCSQTNCTDGFEPLAGLIQATDGSLYGTTYEGGTYNGGTVFKIDPSGELSTIYNFCSQTKCTDGGYPGAGLIQVTNGDFYGTTEGGGANGAGTIYKITPSGHLSTIYSFCSQTNCTDGSRPEAGLIQGTDGVFYGTTLLGGANSNIDANCDGCGTVFKITQSGALTTLYSFCLQNSPPVNCTDGWWPTAGLVQDTDGNLYGTTEYGGNSINEGGTVFKITPGGTLTTVYSFCSQSRCTDGFEPLAGLIPATDGSFYGTTYEGGAGNRGTVYKINPSGTLTTVYSKFSIDDTRPAAGLLQATNGKFYGTTYGAAHSYDSGVFRLSVGLRPFVALQPTSGAAGTAVIILGMDLTDTTGVTFNGTAATFTVVSASEITTTVPAGATKGFVEVTTPSSSLKSNAKFKVTP